MSRRFVPFAFILLLSGAAPAGTIDVPGDHPTIQAAIDAAAFGDTVRVHPGTYPENIDFKGKAVTVKSFAGPESTVIDGGLQGSAVTFSSGEGPGSMLQGFTIRHGSHSWGGGIYCEYTTTPTIRDNIITENWADLIGGGICCGRGAAPLIVNNIFFKNAAGAGGGAVGCYIGCSPVIKGATFFGNTANGAGGAVYCEDGCLITAGDSIFFGNHAPSGPEIWIGGTPNPSTFSIRYSDVGGGKGSVHVEQGSTLTWGLGMINADPRFTDPASGDFRLRQHPCETGIDNPCVNGGDPYTPWIQGTTRTDGLQDEDAMDMGYHYSEQYHDADKQYHDPGNTWIMYYTDLNGNKVHDPGEPCGTSPLPEWRGDATCWMNAASNLLSYEGFGYHRPAWIKDGGAHSPSYQPWTNGAAYVEGGGAYRTFDDGGYVTWPLWFEGVTYQCIMTQAEMGAHSWAENPVAWCAGRLDEGHPVGLSVWSGNIPRGAMPRGIFPGDKFYYHAITLWQIDAEKMTVTITDSDDGIDGPRTLFYTYDDFDWIILDLYPGFRKFRVNSATCISSLLRLNDQVIHASTGGTLEITLEAGKENAHRGYLLLGSLSGTVPGTPLPGGGTLPLNWDLFTSLGVLHANSAFFQNFMGTLDPEGTAHAAFHAPADALTPVLQENLYFAYVLGGPMDFVSNPVPVQIVQ